MVVFFVNNVICYFLIVGVVGVGVVVVGVFLLMFVDMLEVLVWYSGVVVLVLVV